MAIVNHKGISVFAAALILLGGLTACVSMERAQARTAQQSIVDMSNDSLLRRTDGSYQYLDTQTGQVRGRETFSLFVYPDGTRTISAATDIYSRNVHVLSVLSVDESFDPLDAFVSIRTAGQLKGRGQFLIGSGALETDTRGPSGRHQERVEISDTASILTHPIAMDGWHIRPDHDDADTVLLYVDGSADFDTPMKARPVPATVEALGRRSITVPAGTFEATGYRLAGDSEIWVATDDRLVVQYDWPSRNWQYQLTSLEQVW